MQVSLMTCLLSGRMIDTRLKIRGGEDLAFIEDGSRNGIRHHGLQSLCAFVVVLAVRGRRVAVLRFASSPQPRVLLPAWEPVLRRARRTQWRYAPGVPYLATPAAAEFRQHER